MNWQTIFSLRKSDRRVLLILLTLLVVVMAVVTFLDAPTISEDNIPVADNIITKTTDSIEKPSPYYAQEVTIPQERFAFDPNTADSTQLLRLGLQPWQVRNIYKYRAAGGVYHKKEDFARLYGLTVKQYRELEPYIQISADYLPAATLIQTEAPQEPDTLRPQLHYPVKLAEGETVNLNEGDTTAFRQVPGIGSYFAKQIVNYRQRLGGYISTDQLDEIEDFPQQAKPYFIVEPVYLQKLKVNKLSLTHLKRHPYINFYQAKAIVDHRRLSGPLHSLAELSHLRDFPEDAIRRLEPYMDYEE